MLELPSNMEIIARTVRFLVSIGTEEHQAAGVNACRKATQDGQFGEPEPGVGLGVPTRELPEEISYAHGKKLEGRQCRRSAAAG